MKKETIGLTLSTLLLFLGYVAIQNYYFQKQQQSHVGQATSGGQAFVASQNTPEQKTAAPAEVQTSVPVTAPQTVTPQVQAALAPVQELKFNGDVALTLPYASLSFIQQGGCLGANALLGAQVAYNDKTPVSVVDNYNVCKAYGFKITGTDLRTLPAQVEKLDDSSVRITQRVLPFEIVRTFKFDVNENYTGSLNIEVKNLSQSVQKGSVDMELGASSDSREAGGMFSSIPHQFHGVAVRLPDETVKRELTPFDSNPEQKIILSEVNVYPTWLTADSLYWMNTVIPQTKTPVDFTVTRTGFNLKKDKTSPVDQTVYEAFVRHNVELAPAQKTEFNYKVYFGPKNETVLKKHEEWKLNETIDYGFFKIVARPLYYILSFIHSVVNNWGVAIIVLTLLINVVFLPLQIKAYVSAQKMQKVQPEIKKLQEQYKEDKVTLQRETMALMAKHGVNPLSGCLPLLPQIPVFFGLDSALRHTFDLRQSPFFFWIHDLTLSDPYFVLPLLMAVLMIGYQKMIPMPSMDPAQAKMMKILPIIFSVFMIFYPSGLALYVITNTVVSMVRQKVLMKRSSNA